MKTSRLVSFFLFFIAIFPFWGMDLILAQVSSSESFPIPDAKKQLLRDDFLWHAESAGTSYSNSGNVSIMQPSRFGINHQWELSTHLLMNYWVPNLFVKKLWMERDLVVSSSHGIFSATPGLRWSGKQGFAGMADSVFIPMIFSMHNELLVSKAVFSRQNCVNPKPFLVLTGSFAVVFGVPFQSYTNEALEGHFLANRGEVLAGRGAYLRLKGWADWQWHPSWMLRGGLFYYAGTFQSHHALEQQAQMEYFVLPQQFSVSVGYRLSMADYLGENFFGIIPFIDVSWYFGKKENLRRGLFPAEIQSKYQKRNSPTR